MDATDWLDPQAHTLAERLVKELLLADEADSPRTALRMKLLARQVTLRYGRTQVLEWYLNSADFGHNTFGAESAAQLYLGKSAADLNIAESALLVSLIESPALNPVDAPAAALENQQQLLKTVVAQGVLSAEEFNQASAQPLTFAPLPASDSQGNSGFVQYAEQQLGDLLGANRVARGGLDVITTLDATLQAQLDCTTQRALLQIVVGDQAGANDAQACPAAAYLPTQQFDWQGSADLLSASLILDPQNGQILAYKAPTSLTNTPSIPNFQAGSLLSPSSPWRHLPAAVPPPPWYGMLPPPCPPTWTAPPTLMVPSTDRSITVWRWLMIRSCPSAAFSARSRTNHLDLCRLHRFDRPQS